MACRTAWTRAFSSSCQASTSKLSPLNKKSIARQRRTSSSPTTLTSGTSIVPAAASVGNGNSRKRRMSLIEAATFLSDKSSHTPNAAFEVDVLTKPANHVQLNALRGRVFLPHSTEGSKRPFILAIAPQNSPSAKAAAEAGADLVASDEIAEKLLDGTQPLPDKLLTTPEMVPLFTRNPQLARLLGPKGLMPSAKRGTVSEDLGLAVREARGALDWKGDQRGSVRTAIGRLRFKPDELEQNVKTLIANVSEVSQGGAKPTTKSGKTPGVTRVILSSTQGPGIELTDF